MPTRSLKSAASKPSSNSLVFSGFRSTLPEVLTVTPETSAPPRATVTGENRVTASRNPGRNPDLPHAARNRSVDKKLPRGKKSSSPITHETWADGYVTNPKSFPNALLSSPRMAADTNNLSLQPISVETYAPIVLISEKSSLTLNSDDVVPQEAVPGTRPDPLHVVRSRRSTM